MRVSYFSNVCPNPETEQKRMLVFSQSVCYKGESNDNLKNLDIFISYFIEHKSTTFLCSLHCLSYKCFSASEVHEYLYKKFFSLRALPLVHQVEESLLQN